MVVSFFFFLFTGSRLSSPHAAGTVDVPIPGLRSCPMAVGQPGLFPDADLYVRYGMHVVFDGTRGAYSKQHSLIRM